MESYLGELKKQLQCSLCSDTLVEPKLVDCFHVFCKLCIKRNAEVDQEEVIFKCPQCDSKTLLQDLNDVEDLQISPVHARILKGLELIENQKICSVSSSHPEALWQCLDCDRSLCEECLPCHSSFFTNHKVVSLSELMKEDIDKLLKREPFCKTHDNQSVELFCQDCDMLICLLCWKEYHQNHKTKAMQDIIAIERDSLFKNLEQINKMTTDEKEKKQQEEIALIIEIDGEKATKQVKELAEKLIKTIRNNEQQLLDQIRESTAKAKRNLRIINHTTQVQEYIKYFMENSTASEMIDTRHDKSSQNHTYEPFNKTIGGIKFKPNEELCEQAQQSLGLIRTLKKAIIVKRFTRKAKEKGKLSAKLQSRKVTQGNRMADNSDSDSQQMAGHSELKDALNTGSKNFTGIAVNKANTRIAVADCESHCVRVYSMEGELLLTYGSKGSGEEQLNCPHGLAFLNETDLVIADGKNHRICIVNTTTGEPHSCMQSSRYIINSPCGVHVDNDGEIIVCDQFNSLLIYSSIDSYPSRINGVPCFPHSVVKHCQLYYVTNKDMVHVVEIELDKGTSKTVTTIGVKDYTDGQLQRPRGLAIDNDDNLLVCDEGTNLIYQFTLEGRYIGQSGQLANSPRHIVVLNDGQVICTTKDGVVFFDKEW